MPRRSLLTPMAMASPDSADVDTTGGEDRDGIDDFADVDFVATSDVDCDGIIDSLDSDVLGDRFLPIIFRGEPILLAGLPDTDGNNTPDLLKSNEPAAATADIAVGFIRTGLSGRGGCTTSQPGSNGPLDPLLAILAALALLGLRLRWRVTTS